MSPLSTRSLMSLPVLRMTPSAGNPLATAWPWADDGPYDARMVTPDPCGVLRNSSISFVSTGRGVEYATRFRVTSFELVVAAIAAPATVVANAATATEIQANLFRCIALLGRRMFGCRPRRLPALSTGKV